MAKWSDKYYVTFDIPYLEYCHIGLHVHAGSMSEALDNSFEMILPMLSKEAGERIIITRIEHMDEEEAEIADKFN